MMVHLGQQVLEVKYGKESLAAGVGTSSSAIGFGGYGATYPAFTATEEYDGTSWTTLPATLATGRSYLSSAGTVSLALAMGGYTGGPASSALQQKNGLEQEHH
jgi:hypothetical protein